MYGGKELHKIFGDKTQYLDLAAAPDRLTALRTELANPNMSRRYQIAYKTPGCGGSNPMGW